MMSSEDDKKGSKARQSHDNLNHENRLTIGRLVVLNSDPTDVIQKTVRDEPRPRVRRHGTVSEKLVSVSCILDFRF